MSRGSREREISACAEMLRTLGHPVRLKIVAGLLKGTKCVNDIRELAEVRQANISQHLTVLRHSGLVDYERKGTSRCYFLTNRAMVRKLLHLLGCEHTSASAKKVRRRSRSR